MITMHFIKRSLRKTKSSALKKLAKLLYFSVNHLKAGIRLIFDVKPNYSVFNDN